MRVNVYAEEMTDRVEVIGKTIDGTTFTGLRLYLELPATVDGKQYQGPFMHRPGDDDSSAVTFWGKRDLRSVLLVMLGRLDDHYRGEHYDGPVEATTTVQHLAADNARLRDAMAQLRGMLAAQYFFSASEEIRTIERALGTGPMDNHVLPAATDEHSAKALTKIMGERLRQRTAEGYTLDHDDEHTAGELAMAAAAYALCAAKGGLYDVGIWPWKWAELKPRGAEDDLVRAGALIVAELERLQRKRESDGVA